MNVLGDHVARHLEAVAEEQRILLERIPRVPAARAQLPPPERQNLRTCAMKVCRGASAAFCKWIQQSQKVSEKLPQCRHLWWFLASAVHSERAHPHSGQVGPIVFG